MQIEDSDEEMEEDADTAFARKLQEEEYAKADGPANKRQKTSKFQVDDSEDYDSELSEPLTIESEDDMPLIKRGGRKTAGLQKELEKAHKGKKVSLPAPAPSKGKKKATPVRTAHANARKSIGSTLKTKVEDSESEPEALSEPDSEDDFVAGDESEVGSTGVSDTESDALLGASRDSTAAPTAPPARRIKGGRGLGRRRGGRFGNHTAEDAAQIGRDVEEIVMGRKERERKKLEKAHPNIKTMWKDLEKVPVIKPVEAEQPESINRKLKNFQLEGLYWMTRQEKSGYKGGLLGDEMGMGKTIQAVSLIMSDHPQKVSYQTIPEDTLSSLNSSRTP